MLTSIKPIPTTPVLSDKALLAHQLSKLDFTCVEENNKKRVFRCNYKTKAGQPIYLVENGVEGALYIATLGVTSTAKPVLRGTLEKVILHLLAMRLTRLSAAGG